DEQAVFTLHDVGTKCRLTCSYRNKVIGAGGRLFRSPMPNPPAARSRRDTALLLRRKRECLPGRNGDGDEPRIDCLQSENGAAAAKNRSGQYLRRWPRRGTHLRTDAARMLGRVARFIALTTKVSPFPHWN